MKVGLRTQQELVQIAANAKRKGAKLILREVALKTTADLVQIAANAPGHVTFVIDD